jgi:uncharacterized Zn finger protein (UPF0148 family)
MNMAKKGRPGYKLCPKCKKLVKGPRTKTCPHCGHEFEAEQKKAKPVAQAPAPQPAPAAVEAAPAKPANAVTIEQIKAVSQMVQTIGGFRRLHEMLGVIKEVGGVKKFKDLLEAMAVGEKEEGIPF